MHCSALKWTTSNYIVKYLSRELLAFRTREAFFTRLIFLLCSYGSSANVSYNMSRVLTYPGQGVVGIVWWGRLRLACKKHRNGSRRRKDLVMNEAIMRETIAFFSQRRSTTGSVGGGVRALVLQCSTPTYLRDLIVRFFILHMSISIKTPINDISCFLTFYHI